MGKSTLLLQVAAMLGSDTSVIIPSSNGNGAGQKEEEGEEGREASEDDHADASAPGILGAGEAVLYVSAEESVEQVNRKAAAFPLKLCVTWLLPPAVDCGLRSMLASCHVLQSLQ